MILKLTRAINRKVRSNYTLAFMRYIRFSHTHLGIFLFSFILKKDFLFCIRKAKS